MKDIVKSITPPLFYTFFSKMYKKSFSKRKTSKNQFQEDRNFNYIPLWHIIKGGVLNGREFLVDTKDGYWQREIVEGTYDDFFFNYLNKLNLEGKAIFEIGAHIGYHAMNFAVLVGEKGQIIAFEPNIHNRERFKLNLSKNKDLESRIKLHDMAVSNSNGEVEFNFSEDVDNGKSSGSFIMGAHTPYALDVYKQIGFKKAKIKSITLDNFINNYAHGVIPFLIKIDVEGAENYVLEGSINTIKSFKPIILIEVHSIINMLKTCDFFYSLNYKIDLLKEEPDGRCFIVATHNILE